MKGMGKTIHVRVLTSLCNSQKGDLCGKPFPGAASPSARRAPLEEVLPEARPSGRDPVGQGRADLGRVGWGPHGPPASVSVRPSLSQE